MMGANEEPEATRTLRTLREWRARQRMSQGELAMRVGVGQTTISAIEHERLAPSLPVARRIAQVFGVHVDDIAWGKVGDAPAE